MMKSRCVMLLLALTFALVGSGFAQEVDPKIDDADLKTKAEAMEAAALEAYAKKWLEALKAKDAEAAQAAKDGKDQNLISELDLARDGLKRRVLILTAVMEQKDLKDKAGAIAGAAKAYSETHTDLKSVSGLVAIAKTWLTSPDGGIRVGLNILAFIVILIVAKILANIAGTIIEKTLRASKLKISDLLRDFFVNATKKVIFFGGLIMALGKIGIDTAPLLAGLGVAGFVIGFALQGTLSNFASGIMILLYRPYDIGDVVSAAGATGKVTAMSLVSTTLTTPDNQIVVIPNSSIWGGVITNITGNPTRRVDMVFGIGYDDDIAKAMKVLEEIVTAHDKVLKDPALTIQLHELADSSVNFVVRPWTKTSDYWAVYWDIHRAVKERFDAEGISIPYPQQDVHVHQVGGEN